MSVITLLTDFGTVDGYVGAMKGVLATRAPGVHVVDLAHDVRRHDIVGAAFALAQAAPYFPAGTVHVVVVDPGVGGARRPVVVDDGHQRYVAPDNGVLSLAVPAPVSAHAIEAPAFRAATPAATFHGRDIFAVAAARLATGAAAADAGPSVELEGVLPLYGEHRADGGSLYARVLHVDAFGNLITDLRGDRVPAGAELRARGLRLGPLRTTYEDVARGELLAYVGSGGTVEVAVREGSAAVELDMTRGDAIEVASDGG